MEINEKNKDIEFLELFEKIKVVRDVQWEEMFEEFKAKDVVVVNLWEDGAPDYKEEYQQKQPRLAIYPPQEGPKTGSFIICVGGAFMFKSYNEAIPVAEYFYHKGFHTAILDYRISPYSKLVSVADGHRAVRYLRCHANEYNIDSTHIVLGGFSAGGILSNMAASTYTEGNPEAKDLVERFSSRPDAVIIGYGAFSEILNVGAGLMFNFEEQNKLARTSPDLTLHPDCPPYFLFQTTADDPRNIINMEMRLAEMGIPFEAHLFHEGSHGQGLYDGKYEVEDIPHTAHWSELAVEWLKNESFPTAEV